jgi:hypothetical protein
LESIPGPHKHFKVRALITITNSFTHGNLSLPSYTDNSHSYGTYWQFFPNSYQWQFLHFTVREFFPPFPVTSSLQLSVLDCVGRAGVHLHPGGEGVPLLWHPVPSREEQLRVDSQLSRHGPHQVPKGHSSKLIPGTKGTFTQAHTRYQRDTQESSLDGDWLLKGRYVPTGKGVVRHRNTDMNVAIN